VKLPVGAIKNTSGEPRFHFSGGHGSQLNASQNKKIVGAINNTSSEPRLHLRGGHGGQHDNIETCVKALVAAIICSKGDAADVVRVCGQDGVLTRTESSWSMIPGACVLLMLIALVVAVMVKFSGVRVTVTPRSSRKIGIKLELEEPTTMECYEIV
jgi:hypothetical protein